MAKLTSTYRPLDLKCQSCEKEFKVYIWYIKDSDGKWAIQEKQEHKFKCINCGETKKLSKKKKEKVKTAAVIIPKKHQAAPSDKTWDTHPLDDGIPFGEVPGDEDYEWLNDPDVPFGPLP